MQVCDPLPPTRRDIEIAYRGLDLRSDVVPVELRIFVNNVCRRLVAERFVHADFFKFVEQGIRFLQVVGVAELPDEVGRAQQQALFFVQFVV